jgi:glyoxylase I family protein
VDSSLGAGPMSPSVGTRWSHAELGCRDQAATEAFYTRWFGFRRARVADDGDIRVVFLRHGDACLELSATDAAGTVGHIAFQVDDLDGFLAADAELPISLGPLTFDAFIVGWKTVWLTDPDGVIVEVSQGFTD